MEPLGIIEKKVAELLDFLSLVELVLFLHLRKVLYLNNNSRYKRELHQIC